MPVNTSLVLIQSDPQRLGCGRKVWVGSTITDLDEIPPEDANPRFTLDEIVLLRKQSCPADSRIILCKEVFPGCRIINPSVGKEGEGNLDRPPTVDEDYRVLSGHLPNSQDSSQESLFGR